jgi:hypothetical protein
MGDHAASAADQVTPSIVYGFYDPKQELFSFNERRVLAGIKPSINGVTLIPGAISPSYAWNISPFGSGFFMPNVRRYFFPFPFVGPKLVPLPSVDSIIKGRSGFYVVAAAAYRDIFKNDHHTADCLAYDFRNEDFRPCVGGHMQE